MRKHHLNDTVATEPRQNLGLQPRMNSDPINWDEHLTVTSVTHVGMRRANNQDSYVVLLAEDRETWQSRGHFFAVADGMGAHAAGELASKIASEGVPHRYYKHREHSPPEAILRSVTETNEEINRRGQANADFHNMGTTFSSLLLLPQGAVAAHVGDSRVYRLRDNRFEQLTFDHSLVWEMRAAGQIKDNAATGIPRNVITRSLGPNADVQVDLEGPFPIQPDDIFLICSDGLMARMSDAEIGSVLSTLPSDEATEFLVDLTNARGGPDNSTLIVVKIHEGLVTSGAERVSPLTVGSELQTVSEVHPAWWIVVVAGTLIALILLAAQFHLPAGIAFGFTIVAAAIAAYQKFGTAGGNDGTVLTSGRKLGRGPYMQKDCPPSAKAASYIIQSIHQVACESSCGGNESALSRLNACLDEAEQNVSKGQLVDALRLCSVATKILLENN